MKKNEYFTIVYGTKITVNSMAEIKKAATAIANELQYTGYSHLGEIYIDH